ncbi:exosortase [Marinobacter orientalis]|uniref:Exosortase n=1 Tax=Marinobacter orientalis TaxID=1928859 RepID=A0A7Y0RCM5_9GAMM|nr:exosortase [Marinobacter orientalis]NMT63778.1 exosortase [Marinobacter orientalis]TGX49887.1 exosortase [Marinobacter orientalis]
MTIERIQDRSLVQKVLPFLVIFGALFLLIWPTVEGIVSRWFKFDESYSHGLLLLLVSAVLIVRTVKRDSPVPGFYPLWLLPFALALIAYGLGDVLRVQALQELTIVPLLLGTLAIFLGWQQVKAFIIPVGILFFTVPVWDYLSWTLQVITVEINRLLLGFFDIDFEVEGVFVYLIGVGAFEVAHGCSGLRYLLVGQALAALYGELNFRCLRSRIVFFLTAVGFALLANWIRVFVIIYMGYETNMESSLIRDHDNFGWWVFAGTLVPLFLIGRKLEMTNAEQAPRADRGLPATDKGGYRRLWSGVAATSALPVLLLALLPSSAGEIKPSPDSFDLGLNTERYGPLFGKRLSGWKPQVRNPDLVFVQTVFDRGAVTGESGPEQQLFVGVYSYEYQRHRAELVQYYNRIYDRDEWLPEKFFRVMSPSGVPLQGVTLRSLSSGKYVHLAYGYYVAGLWEIDQWRAKLAQVMGFFSPRTDASLIIFGTACEDCDGEAAVGELVSDVMPPIVNQVDQHFQK